MVFGAIGCFDNALLLLKLFLNAPSLSHTSGERHRGNYKHGYPRLQSDQRRIFRFSDKRAETMQGPPHRDRRQYENAVGRFKWSEAKGHPNHDGAANEADGIIPRGNLKPPAKNNATEQHQQQKKHTDFGSLLLIPASL